MGFMDRTKATADRVDEAEQELNEALAKERPEQALDKEAEEAAAKAKAEGQEDEEIEEVIDGHNWKDRYGNLQRLYQRKIDEYKTQTGL